MIDINKIKSEADVLKIIESYMHLEKSQHQYTGICPFHNERSGSFFLNVERGKWKCFGCGKSGDVIDFLVLKGKTFTQAIKEISSDEVIIKDVPIRPEIKKKTLWKQIFPKSIPKEIIHYKYGLPNDVYTYRNQSGSIICYTCRFNMPDGTKQVLPYSFCINEQGREGWMWFGMEKPRILYNLHTLLDHKTILIGEGEKTANAMVKYFGDKIPCVTWIGGTAGVQYADFSPLYGRTVLIWPDNDEPGLKAAFHIYQTIKEFCRVKMIKNSPDFPKGWDVADAEWTKEEAINYLKQNIINV